MYSDTNPQCICFNPIFAVSGKLGGDDAHVFGKDGTKISCGKWVDFTPRLYQFQGMRLYFQAHIFGDHFVHKQFSIRSGRAILVCQWSCYGNQKFIYCPLNYTKSQNIKFNTSPIIVGNYDTMCMTLIIKIKIYWPTHKVLWWLNKERSWSRKSNIFHYSKWLISTSTVAITWCTQLDCP